MKSGEEQAKQKTKGTSNSSSATRGRLAESWPGFRWHKQSEGKLKTRGNRFEGRTFVPNFQSSNHLSSCPPLRQIVKAIQYRRLLQGSIYNMALDEGEQ